MSCRAIVVTLMLSAIALGGSAQPVECAENCAKARQYYELGKKLVKYEERRAAFEKAVDLCPSYVEAHVNLADAYERLAVSETSDAARSRDLFDRAIREYCKAIELDEGFSLAHLGLAEVYAAEGLYRKSKEAYETVLRLQPHNERARSGLAAVEQVMEREHAGERNLARHGLAKAHEIVREVKTSSLNTSMASMGPADYTVVRARIRFPNIIFDGWSSQLNRRQSVRQLNEVGKALASDELEGYTFWIDGHANTVGLEQRNGAQRLMSLSEDRAHSVRRHLVRKFRIDPNRVVARGFGCTRLRFPDDTEEHREMNRRVEIVFRRQDSN